MASTNEDLMKLILDTKAVSIWNRERGPVYWYAANIPGPFYVNTENVIGAERAAVLLEKITKALAETNLADERAKLIEDIILTSYGRSPDYQRVIQMMADKIKETFTNGSFTAISGGERRDWLFSIPLAKLLGVPHLYIFKNLSTYAPTPIPENSSVLHVSDLINNAASYFDAWLPALAKAKFKCAGTLCVAIRGSVGADKLKAAGQKVEALTTIDIAFFEKCMATGLLDADTLTELDVFFKSQRVWTATYLLRDKKLLSLFDVPSVDAKSFERLTAFFEKDPWGLKNDHADFFAAIAEQIKQRRSIASA